MSKFLRNIFLFLILFKTFQGNTQSYLLSSFPAEKELSSRQITCFFQDSKGFMWIGTEDGLNFYNGNSIKSYKHEGKNKNSLGNNYVQNICEDRNGNLWIGTATGIDRFTPATHIFVHYTADDQNNSFGFKNKVYGDRAGNIWAGNKGLFKFDTTKHQFKRIINSYSDTFFGSRLANSITGFYQDSHNNYWIGTYDGLFIYNDLKKTFTRIDVPPGDENYKKNGILFSSVYEDTKGNLFVGTWGYGVFRIMLAEQKLIPLEEKTVSMSYTSQQLNGRELLWCSGNGLLGFDNNDIYAHLLTSSNDPYSLREDHVSTLFTDRQGQLWIGFETKGIQILNPGNQLIKTYFISSEKDKDRIPSVAVIRKKNNSLYIGGWYGDALCKLGTGYTVEKWWQNLPTEEKEGKNVSDLYIDKEGNIWITTFNGIVFLDEKRGAIKTYRYPDSINSNNRFLKILPEGDSVLWLGGYWNGLTRFSLRTHTMEMIGNKNDRPIYWKMVHDKRGNIWCSNNNGMLDKFNPVKKEFATSHFDSLTEQAIYYDMVYDSSSDNLWVTTANGLLKINADNLEAQIFTEKEGLPTSNINLITMDKRHRLWIGTSRGLSLYMPENNSFLNFYSNNGLSSERLDHSLSVEEDGKLYIGAENSFMVMDINQVNNSRQPSPVYIISINENGNLLQPHQEKKGRTLELDYNQNSLTFEFAIIDFINAEDNQLFYQLEGWDKDFIRTKKGEAAYNKLPPGTYTFHVEGINHSGVRNEKGDTITIIIHPPFWRTWWFITLMSALFLAVLVLAVRYVSQRNLKEKILRIEKEQAIEKERNRISKDMHDDLGSGLTKIAIMSEVVKKQFHEPEKARQQLENISESSRELVDNLQDIIWVLNPKNDTLENLAAYIREYALKFFEAFGIEVIFNYPDKFPGIKLSEEKRRNIFLAVKETLTNIGKHAWCNKVTISITHAGHEIKLIIEDDGKGFDIHNTRQFGNGLINMQHRIEQVDGTYTISSEPGKGTATMIIISA